jgi:two-component system response regulator RegA
MQMPHKSILLVEDDSTFREVLARALTRKGYDVHTAGDPAAALEIVAGHAIDHGVLDMKLGDESGLDLIVQLRECRPAINILVFTGYASIATAVRAIRLGANNYLAKPVDAAAVIQALTRPEEKADISDEPMSVRRLEWEHIQKVLDEHQGNISAAARSLKMHRRTLQRKLAKRPVKS